jgi:DNA-binding FrmR family transcriptional regulator
MSTDPTHDAPAHFRHSYTKDRRQLLNRLRRIEGQARGLQRLVEEEAYCLDLLQQVEALTAAADQVGLLLLEDHLAGCLSHAIASGQGEPYVSELMAVVRRTMGRPPARPRKPASAWIGQQKGSAAGGNHDTPGKEYTEGQ